jgi:hypothetical protein
MKPTNVSIYLIIIQHLIQKKVKFLDLLNYKKRSKSSKIKSKIKIKKFLINPAKI